MDCRQPLPNRVRSELPVIRSQSGNLAETRPARGRYNTSRFGSHSGNACKLGRPEQQSPCYDTIMRREPTQRISTGPERSVQRNALRLDRQDAAILSVMSTFEPLLTLKLSVQVALLGEVTDRLVSVTCGLKDRHIQIRAYFSGRVTEEDIERIRDHSPLVTRCSVIFADRCKLRNQRHAGLDRHAIAACRRRQPMLCSTLVY